MKRRAGSNPDKEKYWRAAMHRFAQSRKSIAVFCKQEGFNVHTFQYWRTELKRRGEANSAAADLALNGALLPVRVIEERCEAHPGDSIEVITSDGIQVRLPAGCGAAMIREVIAGLRSC